jgi:hypothetical protein
MDNQKPSRKFCKTGILEDNEKYHPDLHNAGETIEARCKGKYSDEELANMAIEEGGGKHSDKKRRSKHSRKTRRVRKHKRKGARKSRKH